MTGDTCSSMPAAYPSLRSRSAHHRAYPPLRPSILLGAHQADHEEDVFLAEMGHKDTNDANKSWSLRVGSGGNIYSYIGAYGEVIPPQYHDNGPFVDEVWQTVAVDTTVNNPAAGKSWFIHQAGTYEKDDGVLGDDPFFSPNTVKYCDKEKRECGFASWGQQAHTPTQFQSHVLYYTRFKDCGNGVLETVWGFHNMAGDHKSVPNYLNVPWGGVRGSILSDVAHAHKDGSDTANDFFKVVSRRLLLLLVSPGMQMCSRDGTRHPALFMLTCAQR